MRILHTSDWHLGRRIDQHSLAEPHERFLSWLTDELLPEEKPDLIVVAGDIYDRAIPPTDAIELFEDTLSKIRELKIQTLITSGNHDSRIRLGTNTRFMESSGLHFRTRLNQVAIPVVIEHGEVILLAYGIPYIEPDVDTGDAPHQWNVAATQTDVLQEAMRLINLDVEARKKKSAKVVKVTVASHAFVMGASASDSERNIKVGGLGQADAGVFEGADYVAMGHLHGPKHSIKAAGSTVLRYSGSPIPFSFSERDHLKQVLMLTIDEKGVDHKSIEVCEVPQTRKMQQFEGTLSELTSSKFPATENWVKIVLTDQKILDDAGVTLRRKFPNLLELEFRRFVIGNSDSGRDGVLLSDLSPEEVTRRFVARVTAEKPTKSVADAIDDCCAMVNSENIQVNK